ncbi:SDR family NAD(P)-dependent oxidoreductase [Streptomyces sp. 900105755]
MVALGAAKAALEGLARCLAQELCPHGITVNVIAPGAVEDTRMAGVTGDAVRERQVAATPLGRLARPADVAQAVAFYTGEDGSFMTGTTAAVNGGTAMDRRTRRLARTERRPPGPHGREGHRAHRRSRPRRPWPARGTGFQIPTVGVAVDPTPIPPDGPRSRPSFVRIAVPCR